MFKDAISDKIMKMPMFKELGDQKDIERVSIYIF